MKLHGIYGAGGFGRQVLPLAREMLAQRHDAEVVFIDDGEQPERVNGHRCLSWQAFLDVPAVERAVCLAVSDGSVRERLAETCAAAGVPFFPVRGANVIVMDVVEIGEGAILSPFVTLNSNIRIGRHFQANFYSYVSHDCVIGDFVTFAPGAKCSGNVVIGDHAYIGAGAVLRQGRPGAPLTIGRRAVVGMGAVVTRDVPPDTTVVGNPARPLERRH